MNILKDEENKKKYLNKYFTEEGLKALETRLKFLINLYIENKKYPRKATMLGFMALTIHSKQHHEGMIDNMAQLLGKKEIKIEVDNNDS